MTLFDHDYIEKNKNKNKRTSNKATELLFEKEQKEEWGIYGTS
jgi:hypothetical protein